MLIDHFLYSINAIFPIILLVVIGTLLKKRGIIGDTFTEAADWLVFKIGLPCMLFLEVASCRVSEGIDWKMVLFLLISVTLCFFLMTLFALLFIRDPSKRGSFIQGASRSNFAILGVPLAVNMFGDAGAQAIAIAMPFVILMFNSYSVVILSLFSGDASQRLNRKAVFGILKNVVTNPLIIAVALALPFVVLPISMPLAMEKTVGYLSDLATPLALISLGSNFKMESLKGRVGYAVAAALLKTAVLPAVAITAAILVGLRGPALGVVLICFGSPTAVSSYIMAKKMGNDHELAAQVLLLSTLICSLTIFAEIFLLRTLHFI